MIEPDLVKTAIWESTKETFETMISLPVEMTEETVEESDPDSSVVCTITFTGPLLGVFALRCSMECAEQMAKTMLMAEPDQNIEQAEVFDALGEITNMVIGGVKTRIRDAAGELNIFIPTTIIGRQIQPAMGKLATRAELVTRVDGKIMQLALIYKQND